MSEYTANDYPERETPIAAEEPRRTPGTLSERVRSLRLQEKTARPRAASSKLPWLLCFVLLLCCAGLAYVAYIRPASTSPAATSESASENKGPASLSTESSTASSGEVVVERKGYVIPAHQILISPKVSGMIIQLGNGKRPLEEGMRVQKDEVLAVLESVDYQADYDHSKATVNGCWQKFLELYTGNREQEIKQAKASLDEMEANRKQLYLDWRRNTRLRGTAVADRDLELAEALYKAMERRVEQMKQAYGLMLEGPRAERIEAAWADLEQAEADLVKARWRLDNCVIRAPISGTILTKKAEIGNLVNPIAFSGSTALCEMADLSELEVDISIEEREVAKIFKDQLCRVRPEAYPERTYNGRVSRLMPTADRAKSAIPVRVVLTVPKEEEGVYLKPEMGAVVSFLKKNSTPATKK
ncbi:MAG TPA: efflux RND transporter periplasmic adaptor subunit [Gemmataceae bacterium]|nr:efflux RND transporter periplasmic adaptor subunit [Gemmataceae bacterium]